MIVGVGQAKTHLSKLLDQVEAGEVITITRRGKIAALLVLPPLDGAPRMADAPQDLTPEARSEAPAPVPQSGRSIVPQKPQNRGLTLAELLKAAG